MCLFLKCTCNGSFLFLPQPPLFHRGQKILPPAMYRRSISCDGFQIHERGYRTIVLENIGLDKGLESGDQGFLKIVGSLPILGNSEDQLYLRASQAKPPKRTHPISPRSPTLPRRACSSLFGCSPRIVILRCIFFSLLAQLSTLSRIDVFPLLCDEGEVWIRPFKTQHIINLGAQFARQGRNTFKIRISFVA